MKKIFDLQYQLVYVANADIMTASVADKGNLAPGSTSDGTGAPARQGKVSVAPVREGL